MTATIDARIGHGHLVERHRDDDAQKARKREKADVLSRERGVFLLHRARGERDEQNAADEKAQTCDLHGRKHAAHGFEHDLHRAENDGTEDDIDIAERERFIAILLHHSNESSICHFLPKGKGCLTKAEFEI